MAETGDAWFNGMRLTLPKNCPFEIQMQYGSIGWSVGALVRVFNGAQGKAQAFKVLTYQALLDAIAKAKASDTLCFIEVVLDKNDCNKNLLEWGARVALYNSRPPKASSVLY